MAINPYSPHPSREYALLSSLQPYLNYAQSATWPHPIGDDTVLRVSRKKNDRLIFTTDTQIENVHFSTRYMSFKQIGYRAMAVNLSDCAAAGAVPDGALINLIIPSSASDREIKQLYQGMYAACKAWNFPIVGGDLARGGCWTIAVTLIGRIESGGRFLRRSGIFKGDGLWVSGYPGESSAGLAALQKWGSDVPKKFASLAKKHIKPIPRIKLGQLLGRSKAVHGCIDVSDGISKECATLCYENNLGLTIDGAAILISAGMAELGRLIKAEPLNWVLHGGEDYELLFAATKKFDPAIISKKANVRLIKIGEFCGEKNGVSIKLDNGRTVRLPNRSWDHRAVGRKE